MRFEFCGVTIDKAFQLTEVVDKWKLAGLNCKAIAASNDFGLYDVFVSGSDMAILPMGDDGFEFKNMKSTETIYVNVDDLIELTIS